MMTLYYSDVLSAHRACAVAKHLNVPVEYRYLDLAKNDQTQAGYLAINPNGKVPTLVKDQRITWESDAIICQLSDDMGADLWPHDTRQTDIIRWFSWNARHFTAAGAALYFENIDKERFRLGPPDPTIIAAALCNFRRYAAVLNEQLARPRAWLVGTSLTVADFSVAAALPYAEQARLPIDEFPNLRRWHDRLNQFDAWREPFPERSGGLSHPTAGRGTGEHQEPFGHPI